MGAACTKQSVATPRVLPCALTALRCLTQLLVERPQFNFSTNIVDVVVPFMCCRFSDEVTLWESNCFL